MSFAIHTLRARVRPDTDTAAGKARFFQPSSRSFAAVMLVLGIILGTGCATTSSVDADIITVTGDITVRGNVPFHEVVLITDDNNWYILEMSDQEREALMTPARARVTGAIRLGEWNGRPFTRMTVHELVAER